jgi:DNA-binding NtrC family response regulator
MAERIGKILAVDDNPDILTTLNLILKRHVERIDRITNPADIEKCLKEEFYDVILLDMNFTKDAISGKEGFDWLKEILRFDPLAVVIFITAYGNTEKAVRAIKEGATDFIVKPWENDKLIATIMSAMKLRQSKLENSALRSRQKVLSASSDKPYLDFVFESESMKIVDKTIRKVAATNANVLILGENGTGKEVAARALHRNSSRADEVFVSIDLGSIPETLFESELFGSEKGSYSSSIADKPGRFEVANKGTLFLDEIGNLSLPMQAKLLTVIEKLEVMRIGALKPRKIDVRLICATNADIHEWVSQGKFRQDLLYRINTVEIQLPPLRERGNDIILLAQHYLEIYASKYKKGIKGFTPEAHRKLITYHWPGNIRELQHAIERAVIMSDTPKLDATDFMLAQSNKTDGPDINSYNLEEVEKNIISQVLAEHHGNVTHAAKQLGLTRTSLYRRMEKHGL